MRRQLYIASLIALIALQVRAGEKASAWLVGKWKSNRELTIATIRLDRPLPPEKQARFEKLFGTMTVTYTTTEISFDTPEFEKHPRWSATESYRVVVSSAKRVVIRNKNPRTKEEESSVINFDSPDRYWIDLSLGGIQGVKGREYFDRIRLTEEEPNKRTTDNSGAAPLRV